MVTSGEEPSPLAQESSAGEKVAVSVVVPTIGRSALLDQCLASVAACQPRPAETLVVDQSHSPELAAVVERWSSAGARLVPCPGLGIARGSNLGVRSASESLVLVTRDDCIVAENWMGTAWRLAQDHEGAILTAQVRAGTDADRTPSTVTRPDPIRFTGDVDAAELYPGNMLVPSHAFLALGGFDERPTLSVAAEDNDLCYRWIRAGGPLAYRPELVTWHHDWRNEQELIQLYVVYGRGEGAFIAKHLHAGDPYVLRFLGRDLANGVRSLGSAVVKRRKRWTDLRRGLLRGVPAGLVSGWMEAKRVGRAPKASSCRVEVAR